MDIIISRARLASDTCNIYFTYIKVSYLLYTCSLDPFKDGILLDTPLVCIHRYCRNATDDEEECERKCTTTPSAREARKRTRKKMELRSLQCLDDPKPPNARHSTAPGWPTSTGRPTHPRPAADQVYSARTTVEHQTSDNLQPSDVRRLPKIRCHMSRAKTSEVRRPPDVRTPESHRTTDIPRTSGTYASAAGPDAHVSPPHLSLCDLDYK